MVVPAIALLSKQQQQQQQPGSCRTAPAAAPGAVAAARHQSQQQLFHPPAHCCIQEGDLVIVYESFSSIKHLYVDSRAQFQNRYGAFQHKDWVGQPFGSKVHCRPPGSGWVYLLAPTPELWTLALRHRTQILFVGDISLVVGHLGLKPGSVALESGTGSGSLTHSLARAVAPHGHVHTFDFHELRAQEAAAEFARHGLQRLITVQQRDIEQQGFPQEALAGRADAVFLDLPGPWKVVPSAAACLKDGGRFCSFSPCIEQVQRTCEALDQHGFTHITTLELLLRQYEVSTETFHTDAARTAQPNKAGRKRRHDDGGGGSEAAAAATDGSAEGSEQQQQQQQQQPAVLRQVMTRPTMEARGHTGYLTFAHKFVPALALSSGGGDSGDDDEDEDAGDDEQEIEEAGEAAAPGQQ